MEIISFLKNPKSYSHKTASEIEHLETHISHVFLCGDYAYKLKKPLDLGFLDFTSLEKRKFYCEEELRLNSIIAPKIYLEVVPIYENLDKFSFQQKGNICDYVLKMSQFEQEQILSSIVERRDFSLDLFTELAQKLSHIHQIANTNREISNYGSVSHVQKVADQNFNQTQQYIGTCLSQQSFEHIQEFTLNFLDKHKSLFETRQKSGKIRECHGDLHLNNICIFNGEIQFFDRIEFNKEFRNIDVVYDLAFLIMDLHYRSQNSAATRVMNEYFEQTGDYEGAAVLSFYACMRAFIRGKVTAFRLNNSEVNSQEKRDIITEAKAYFELAESYAATNKTKLWITSGVSGSGKSTIARKIATHKQFLIIRSDALRKHLTGVPLYKKGPQRIYNAKNSQATYDKLIYLADLLTKFHVSVLLDAKFDKRKLRARAMKLAEQKSIDFKIVYCYAAPQKLKQRLKQRSPDVSDADATLIDQQIESFEDFSKKEKAYILDNSFS